MPVVSHKPVGTPAGWMHLKTDSVSMSKVPLAAQEPVLPVPPKEGSPHILLHLPEALHSVLSVPLKTDSANERMPLSKKVPYFAVPALADYLMMAIQI